MKNGIGFVFTLVFNAVGVVRPQHQFLAALVEAGERFAAAEDFLAGRQRERRVEAARIIRRAAHKAKRQDGRERSVVVRGCGRWPSAVCRRRRAVRGGRDFPESSPSRPRWCSGGRRQSFRISRNHRCGTGPASMSSGCGGCTCGPLVMRMRSARGEIKSMENGSVGIGGVLVVRETRSAWRSMTTARSLSKAWRTGYCDR